MKVLIISASDMSGGAAKAAYRLHKSLLNEGVNCLMLVQDKLSDDCTVIDVADNRIHKGFNKLRPIIDQIPVKFYKNKTATLFSPGWVGFNNVLKKIKSINPDIVHLHWIGNGMIKIEDLVKIKKPIVWSLHDMWAFTGGCHYDEYCGKYRNICKGCKVLNSIKADLSTWVWKRKHNVYSQINDLTVVGLSKWIVNESQKSSLLRNKYHINLPNPIDTNIFKPLDKREARRLWNLPDNKKLILFGAINLTSDKRKGLEELKKALSILNMDKVELVIFGCSTPHKFPDLNFKIHYVGKLYDDISLVTLYSAADVVVVPSLQENLSNTIMESLSCATPVVAFNIGGNSDLIDHRVNGYLAQPFSLEDLAKGIEWILNLNLDEYTKLQKSAREKVLKEFDSRVVAKKYIKLYEEILNEYKYRKIK